MNKIEGFVYELVKKNPKLKLGIRNIYQKFFDLLPKKKDVVLHPLSLKEGFFYGFHDTCPFSNDNSKIIANQLSFDFKMPTKSDEINVGYIEFDGSQLGDFKTIGTTHSWNYHKGCRSQWVNDDEIIFNKADGDSMKSTIVNIKTNQSRMIDFPIDSVSPDGELATSFSYERLEIHMPGYGYAFKDNDSYLSQKSPEKTGLFLIDLKNNTRTLLVNLKELCERSKDQEGALECDHYVTHSEFSPDKRYISFLHRWTGEYKNKRYTKLVIYDLKTRKYEIALNSLMASHYVWNNKNEIIAYCNHNGVDSHVLINVEDFEKNKAIAYPRLNSDGHQTFINDNCFITDTYPDRYRMSKLYKVDILTDKVELLASVYSPKKFQSSIKKGHIACDLHPTASRDGKFVCFDTVKTGQRAIAVLSI